MDTRYEAFCLADPLFYDSPATRPESPGSAGAFAQATMPVPGGWERKALSEWTYLRPPIPELAEQGWKIHVSATLGNAQDVLDIVTRWCVDRLVPFKFLGHPRILLARNSKYADRGGSGKFVTVYPTPDVSLETCLAGLGDALDGFRGPYILSDLRWRDGPVHVRYGAFRERWCRGPAGERLPAIRRPDGTYVPDRRGPVFALPDWVTPPDVLAEALEARNGLDGDDDFPFTITEALHFSNGGGVYRGTDDRTGREVLVKEARPMAGLDREGRDAVVRLEHERRTLERLAGCPGVPAVLDHRVWWEHHFLVREFVDGEILNKQMVRRHPMLHPDPQPGAVADYTRWALRVIGEVERGVEAMHGRGVVFGDLHPGNIIVRDDGSVGFIDFENALPVESAGGSTLGAAGYLAPPSYTGPAIDRYALGCLRLALFTSLAPVLPWDPGKVDQFLEFVHARFPVPDDHGVAVWRDLGPRPFRDRPGHPAPDRTGPGAHPAIWPSGVPDWEPTRDRIAGAILATATPGRPDRLFPGDVRQFGPGGGVGLAYGAAGVLWALEAAGCGRFPEHEKWLIEAVHANRQPLPGLFDGIGGVALTLAALGAPDDAREILDRALTLELDPADVTLQDGLAGVGLALLGVADRTGDRELLDRARDLAGPIAEHLARPPVAGRSPGLAEGDAGPALFLIRLAERTGDTGALDLAARALHRDLDRCRTSDDGTLQADEGWRLVPYLATGSTGVGTVLTEYRRHRDDERFRAAEAGAALAAEPEFLVQAGLLNGRAGLMAMLLNRGATPADPVIRRHVRGLGWHAVPLHDGIGFVGDQLMRLSTDLATGSAGILVVLRAALTGEPLSLPFLLGKGTHRTDGEEVNDHGEGS